MYTSNMQSGLIGYIKLQYCYMMHFTWRSFYLYDNDKSGFSISQLTINFSKQERNFFHISILEVVVAYVISNLSLTIWITSNTWQQALSYKKKGQVQWRHVIIGPPLCAVPWTKCGRIIAMDGPPWTLPPPPLFTAKCKAVDSSPRTVHGTYHCLTGSPLAVNCPISNWAFLVAVAHYVCHKYD